MSTSVVPLMTVQSELATALSNLTKAAAPITPNKILTPGFPYAPGEPVMTTDWVMTNIDNNSTWKSVWDTSTPGDATKTSGSSQYISPQSGRLYKMITSVNGSGVRHSCHAWPQGMQGLRYLVFETYNAIFPWKTMAQRYELDINVVRADGNVLMSCVQQECAAPHGNGMWDVTYSAKWSPTIYKAPMSGWMDNSAHAIRHWAIVTDDGHIIYLGVNVDGEWQPFSTGNTGLCLMNPKDPWGPIGLVIPNYQFEMNAGSWQGSAITNIYGKVA